MRWPRIEAFPIRRSTGPFKSNCAVLRERGVADREELHEHQEFQSTADGNRSAGVHLRRDRAARLSSAGFVPFINRNRSFFALAF